MVIDAVMQRLFGQPFDRDGIIASSGEVIEALLDGIMRRPYFLTKPPKTAGREEFGREFVAEFLRSCHGMRKEDVVATATALTARSIVEAVRQFVTKGVPKVKIPTPSTPLRAGLSQKSRQGWGTQKRAAFNEMILSGGGARNATLVGMLAERLAPLGIVVRFSDEFGLPSEAKEAVAFAVLAYETWNRRASNIPSATGAKRGAVLGKISYV
jgi:anhydro-N-acetylmuramic acid kinase